MATNRLIQHQDASDGADGHSPPVADPGFAAVPVSGILGWEKVRPDAQALYDFAYLLAQIQDQNDPEAGSRWLNS